MSLTDQEKARHKRSRDKQKASLDAQHSPTLDDVKAIWPKSEIPEKILEKLLKRNIYIKD